MAAIYLLLMRNKKGRLTAQEFLSREQLERRLSKAWRHRVRAQIFEVRGKTVLKSLATAGLWGPK
jgi:hypothetical protein